VIISAPLNTLVLLALVRRCRARDQLYDIFVKACNRKICTLGDDIAAQPII
jgi:hypothetical protein